MQYVSRRNPGSRRRVRNAGVAVRTASYQSIQSESTARLLLLARLVHRSVAALLQGVVRVAPTRRDKLRVPCSTVSTRVLLWFTRVGGDPMSVRRLAVIDKLRRPRKRRETILPKPVSPSTFPHRSGRLTPVAPCDSPLTREREALHVRPPARCAVSHDASWPAAATASFRLALRTGTAGHPVALPASPDGNRVAACYTTRGAYRANLCTPQPANSSQLA